MKTIVISDIHGDIDALDKIIYKMDKQDIDKLIVLGDFCSYDGSSDNIVKRINTIKKKMICVKGNCDTDKFINDVGIDFALYRNIRFGEYNITITHGHVYNDYFLPPNCSNNLFMGHTHRKCLIKDDRVVANPGSVAKPRDGVKSYIFIEDDTVFLKDMDDNVIDSCNLVH